MLYWSNVSFDCYGGSEDQMCYDEKDETSVTAIYAGETTCSREEHIIKSKGNTSRAELKPFFSLHDLSIYFINFVTSHISSLLRKHGVVMFACLQLGPLCTGTKLVVRSCMCSQIGL